MGLNITFTGKFSLKQLLDFKTIPELKELGLVMGIAIKGSPKKQYIVEALTNLMLEKPEKVVKSMFFYELKACIDVIEDRMTLDYAEKSGLLFHLNRFGLIYSLEKKSENKCTLHFEEEMAEKLRSLIPAEMERRVKDGSLLAEKLALGCANIYGYTEMYYVSKHFHELEKRIGHSLEETELTKLFYPVLAEMHTGVKRKDHPFFSPFAIYNGFALDDLHIEDEVEPKTYDFDTIIGYGEMPYPAIQSRATGKLTKLLAKHGNPEAGTPENIIRQLWIEKQDETLNRGIPDLNRYFRFSSMDEVQSTLGVLMDFLNSIPYWRLRGNSSEEIGRMEMSKMRGRGEMPRITMGPNMRSMGIESFEQLQEMAACGESFPPFHGQQPFTASPKVGRNDRCPCGSGKKYKHCCGKN